MAEIRHLGNGEIAMSQRNKNSYRKQIARQLRTQYVDGILLHRDLEI